MKLEHSKNKILACRKDGQVVGMINFPEVRPGVVDITHTQVDESMRGRGLAGELMEAAVRQLREENRKAVLSCSYAVRWIAKHPEAEDILENPEEEKKRAQMIQGEACGIRR